MNKLEKVAGTILKQPSYKIMDMLYKKDTDVNITPEEIKYILKDINNFFKLQDNVNIHFFILIDYYREGIVNKNILSSKVVEEIKDISQKDMYVHIIDKNCNVIESQPLPEITTDELSVNDIRLTYQIISYIADLFDGTFIYGYDCKYDVFHGGKLVQPACSIGLNYMNSKTFSCIKPMSEYKELIKDHFKQCVKHSQATDHWNNKEKRILRSSPEDIFKNSLWFYLYMFSEDACDVIAEYPLRSGNRIDIYAKTKDNKIYIFEVKVLGKYYSKGDKGYQEYKDDRVYHGLNQTIVYINELSDNLLDVERAELIIYDAREYQYEITIADTEKHLKMDEPSYLYLESNNATKKAKNMTSTRKSS